jgi:hypothetical protein
MRSYAKVKESAAIMRQNQKNEEQTERGEPCIWRPSPARGGCRVSGVHHECEVHPNVGSLNSLFGSGFGFLSAQMVDHDELCSSISNTAESLAGAKR